MNIVESYKYIAWMNRNQRQSKRRKQMRNSKFTYLNVWLKQKKEEEEEEEKEDKFFMRIIQFLFITHNKYMKKIKNLFYF